MPDIESSLALRRTTFIGELGCNHGGSLSIAKKMVRVFADKGALFLKGQKRDIPSMNQRYLASPYTGNHSFGETYGEHREALEFTWDQHHNLRAYAKECGVNYSVSVWDKRSADEAWYAGLDWVKVPSALANPEFIQYVARHDWWVIVSTGGLSHDEATWVLEYAERRGKLVVLQCTSAYPCENWQVNLAVLRNWQARYQCPIGISGHWKGIQLDSAASALGARIIERHVTLDRASKGTDHAASLETRGVELVIRDLEAVEQAMGVPEKSVLDCEVIALKKLKDAHNV